MPQGVEDRIEALSESALMLATIGAWLELRGRGDVDPEIRAHLEAASVAALGGEARALDGDEHRDAIGGIAVALAEAAELFAAPGRARGWTVEDEQLLEAQGRASGGVVARIASLAQTRPRLRRNLSGTFLDVGTGVGGIALAAARTFPEMRVVGVDVWEPALRLARRNVAASDHAERIRIRRRDVVELEPGPRYDLVWLPTMFLSRAVLTRALERIAAASVPGASLVAAAYTRPPDPFGAATAAIRTLRSGGELLDPAELEETIAAHGWVDAERVAGPLATLVLATLP